MDTGRHALGESPRKPRPRVEPLKGGRPRALRHRPGTGEATRRARGPAWMFLYALLPLSALLLALVAYIPAHESWRRLAEGLVAIVGIGLAWVWVRTNRGALSRLTTGSEADPDSPRLAVEVQKASPQVIRLTPKRSRPEN